MMTCTRTSPVQHMNQELYYAHLVFEIFPATSVFHDMIAFTTGHRRACRLVFPWRAHFCKKAGQLCLFILAMGLFRECFKTAAIAAGVGETTPYD